jgi:translocation and assembly module TamB
VKRLLMIVLGALLLLVMLVATTVVFLGATEGGTRFLAAQAERFLPIRLIDVSGDLWSEVRVGRVELELESQRVRVDNLSVALRIAPLLFDNLLDLQAVRADTVVVERLETETADGALPPPLALPFMPIDIDLASLDIARLEITGAFPMTVHASASWRGDGLTVRALTVDSDVVTGSVEGMLGTGSNPQLRLEARWTLGEDEWSGEGRIDGRVDDFELAHELRGVVNVSAIGRASLADLANPQVDLAVAVSDLDVAEVEIDGIAGQVRGTPENLIADARAGVRVPGYRPFSVSLSVYGPATGPLTIRDLQADALGGRQQAQGSFGWSPGLRLFLGGTVSDIDLAALPGELEGRLSAGIEFGYRDELVEVALRAISGTLHGRPLDGELVAKQRDGGWRVDPLALRVGSNSLNGRLDLLGESLDLEAVIEAPELAALGFPVAGDLAGSVRLSGIWPDLDGRLDVRSDVLAGFDSRIDGAQLEARLQRGVVDATFSAARVARDELGLDGLQFTAMGPLGNLDWTLAWPDGAADGALSWTDEVRVVLVREAELRAIGQTWRIDQALRLRESDGDVELDPVCVSGGGARACVNSFRLAQGAVDTSGELERLPIGLFEPWLPLPLHEEGYLEGAWSVSGPADDWRGQVRVVARQLGYLATENEVVSLPDLEAFGAIGGDTLTLRLLATDEAFSLAGGVRVAPIAPDGELVGTLSASIADLSPLQVFDQRIESLSGSLSGLLNVSGTASAPRAEGRFRLADGALALNDPEFRLDGIDIQLSLDDAGVFEVSGTARQGDNELRISGDGSGLFDDALAFQAALTGSGLRAAHPDWDVVVSPDLNLRYADGRGRVSGRLEVPRAEVRLRTRPTTVPSRSEDVIVLGREPEPVATGAAIRTDVDIILGNDVNLRAFAAQAALEGRLRARVDEHGRTTLVGNLNITGGVLSAQGQTLSIESGSVIYNGPVTRPYVDVRAVRVIHTVSPSVKVGLHIRGDADNLISSVISEPSMSETRALSFLVLGRDIEQGTADSDSGQLMAAAINLGLSRSRNITGELMRMAGLDELSAAAEAENAFAIIAGKRVTDDLYVRYIYNTLTSAGTFLLRYSLTRRWHLEAQSGDNPAMDLLFRIER